MNSFFENLLRFFQLDIIESYAISSIPCIVISQKNMVQIFTILRDHASFEMEQLVDIIAVDYPEKKDRFEVTYHLLNHKKNQRLFVRVSTSSTLSTITSIFKNASWYEREVFDLMGISFSDHPDLRRLLTDYSFFGHPLRKDFPVYGYTEVYFNEETQMVDHKPVDLEKNYRTFDFISKWEGR